MKAKTTQKPRRSGTTAGRRILCGTDFSENAGEAAAVAAALGKQLKEPVALVHAVEKPYLLSPGAEVMKWLMSSRRKSLAQEAERLRKTGANVHETISYGPADEVLVDLANKGQTRMLVVASQGRRGVERWFLGSISERTAERAKVPTLVVRKGSAFAAWIRGDRPLKVFVAFNFTSTSEAAVHWIEELQAIGPCEVVVGYVAEPPAQQTPLGNASSLPHFGLSPEGRALLERNLKERVTDLLGPTPFRARLESNWSRPESRLAELAQEEGADLLVLGSHQYHGFERLWHSSVSRGLLHRATMSVAVVPWATLKNRAINLAPPVQRVLVTTDFSNLANHAISHAYSLLRGEGTVHLIHVIHPQELPGGESLKGTPDRRFKTRHSKHAQACTERLRGLIPPAAANLGILTEVEVIEHHEVAQAICESAERFGAHVICLGTHGRSGVSKALLGSVAQRVMARSPRPLFLVKPPPQ